MNKSQSQQYKRTIPFWVCLLSSIGMLLGGFFAPPMGQIDGSVLTGVGIIFGFFAFSQIPIIIEVAGYTKISSGNTTIEISRDDKDDDEGSN